jgi:cobalt-precorrin-5B (C1)-methyltransferase
MRDPVTEFEYPPSWVEACNDPFLLVDVEKGVSVLCSSGKVLRRGYTTGTTAAAACKAAVLSLSGPLREVMVTLPSGVMILVEVNGADGEARCRKFSGDYPSDATAGIEMIAQARPGTGIRILPGTGIGRFVRDTSRYPNGAPAISPAARDLMLSSVQEAVDHLGLEGATIEIAVNDGEVVGPRTLNPKVGVEGGISLLGTTGLVEPWDDHLEESNLERIARSPRVVLTTGRKGLAVSRRLFPDHEAVLVGVRMERAINAAPGEVILCGLPALILKFLDPDVLDGSGHSTVEELRNSPEWTSRMNAAMDNGRSRFPRLRVVVVDREGSVLGDSG